MTQAARPHHGLLSLLNNDGRSHPKENALAAITFVLGAVAVATAAFYNLHLISCWFGLVAIVTGAWGQFISATTGERFLLVIGMGMAALGFGLGLAHGGLLGGVV
ncbi:hypothetical protein ACFV3R_01645 [Streptomyces sp. NPDC059740]|uniref:hypothetical protein n=1 Tax=Streptomyces sp. NPDC059740 TaxID=3346926 RepID=UPI0036685422